MSLHQMVILASLAVAAGCHHDTVKRACMGGSDASPLVTSAALTRLDVYGATARCDSDGTIAADAGAPLMSRTYAAGEAITLDVAAGHHALVLTSFADAAGTQPLGVACTEADVSAGSVVCFDLTLAPPPDGGVSIGCTSDSDCGDTPGAACCGGSCTNTRTDPLNCNGCGVACTGGDTQCCNGACSNPQSDGANCGGCGNACTAPNATPACTPTGCAVGTCDPGHFDCDNNSANGCECGTSCCTDPINSAAECMVTSHGDGYGHSFSGCYPLGVAGTATTPGTGYSARMAADAAAADTTQMQTGSLQTGLFCSTATEKVTSACKEYDNAMGKLVDCTCWAYDATAGNCKDPQDSVMKPCSSFIGHTFHSTTSCPCVSVTDSAYQ